MPHLLHVLVFRIRYSDVDQMGTYYNARGWSGSSGGGRNCAVRWANRIANGRRRASGCR